MKVESVLTSIGVVLCLVLFLVWATWPLTDYGIIVAQNYFEYKERASAPYTLELARPLQVPYIGEDIRIAVRANQGPHQRKKYENCIASRVVFSEDLESFAEVTPSNGEEILTLFKVRREKHQLLAELSLKCADGESRQVKTNTLTFRCFLRHDKFMRLQPWLHHGFY